jgi:hypothetical protein
MSCLAFSRWGFSFHSDESVEWGKLRINSLPESVTSDEMVAEQKIRNMSYSCVYLIIVKFYLQTRPPVMCQSGMNVSVCV